MNITELVTIYKEMLTPIFKNDLLVWYEDEECVNIILDGNDEEFCFTLYGVDSVRVFWCNECFIFDKGRNLLVSSDTFGEIVYEEEIDIETLPYVVIELVKHLKDAVFISKEERIIGKTPWGYDDIKKYEITAKYLEETLPMDYVVGNISIRYYR